MRTKPEMMAAVLHDVVEDTHCTLADLRKRGIPDEVVQAVDCLTKRTGESYDNFIQRVKTNAISRKVKLADLADNMDITRIAQLSVDDAPRLNKYLRAWRDLSSDPESNFATKSRGKHTPAARKKRSRR